MAYLLAEYATTSYQRELTPDLKTQTAAEPAGCS